MRQLTQQAVEAGAFGFTTSRTNAHKTVRGEMVPGRFAEIDELTGIGGGLGAIGAGAFGMNSDFEDEAAEFDWITRLGRETGRPVWFLLTDRPTDPARWRRIMAGVHRARAAGAKVTAQIAGRPVGVILGVATSLNPFSSVTTIGPSRISLCRNGLRGCAIRHCAGRYSPIDRRRRGWRGSDPSFSWSRRAGTACM
jgi:N-acyl-D-aspartate/D-glutamate deacylase